MTNEMSLPSLATSVVDYLPAATEVTVPLANGKAQYICTLMGGSSWTSTSTPAPLASSSFSSAQDADRTNPLTGVATSFSLQAPLSKPTTSASQGTYWVSSSIVPGTTNISPVENAPLSAEGVPAFETSPYPTSAPLSAESHTAPTLTLLTTPAPLSAEGYTAATLSPVLVTPSTLSLPLSAPGYTAATISPFPSSAPLSAEGYTAPTISLFPITSAPLSMEGSTAVTTIGRFITQTVQVQVVSTTGTPENQTVPFAKLDIKAPASMSGIAASTNLGQLIARPFQTTPSPIVTGSAEEAPTAQPTQITTPSVISTALLTDTADLPGQPTSSPISSLVSTAAGPITQIAPLTQTISDLANLPTLAPPSSEEAPLSASGAAAAVTPGQSITFTPTVCLAPLYSPSISYVTQYQTVTVTATPNSTSSSMFNPNTTFHLSIITIAPTGASTTIAAPSSKSETDNNWTRLRCASAVFVGFMVSLYAMVG